KKNFFKRNPELQEHPYAMVGAPKKPGRPTAAHPPPPTWTDLLNLFLASLRLCEKRVFTAAPDTDSRSPSHPTEFASCSTGSSTSSNAIPSFPRTYAMVGAPKK